MLRARSFPSLVILCALASSAWAEDEEPKNKHLYTLTSSIKNLPEGGAVFELEGTAKNFPDGTLLHVTLNVKAAASPKPVEAAFFMVRVDKERFKARKVYKQQTFAPLRYWAQVDLILSSQRKAVRDWIRRELGLPNEARLVLARKVMEIGTKAEQAAFKEKTLLTLKQFVEGFHAECKGLIKFVSKTKDEYDDYEAVQGPLEKQLTASLHKLILFLGGHVAWHEAQLLAAIRNAAADMGRTFRFHKNNKGSKARRTLKRVDQTFKSLLQGIDARLPKRADPEEDKPDESKDSGS